MFYRSFPKRDTTIRNRNVFTMSSKFCNILNSSDSDSDDFSDDERQNAPIPRMIPEEREREFSYVRKVKMPMRMKDADSDDELMLTMTKKLYSMDDDESVGSDSDYNTKKVRPGQSELQIKKGESLDDFVGEDGPSSLAPAPAGPAGGAPAGAPVGAPAPAPAPAPAVAGAVALAGAGGPPPPEKPSEESKEAKKAVFKQLKEGEESREAPKSPKKGKKGGKKSSLVAGPAPEVSESQLLKDMTQDALAEKAGRAERAEEGSEGEGKEEIGAGPAKKERDIPVERQAQLETLAFTPDGTPRFVFAQTAKGDINPNALEYNGMKVNAEFLSDAPSAKKTVSPEQKAVNRQTIAKAFIAMEELADAGLLDDMELYDQLRAVIPSKDFMKGAIKEARAEKRKYNDERKKAVKAE
jgi:hypothetical protein